MRERDSDNGPVPTTCEMDHLRLHCVTRRIPATELSNAVQTSLYEEYNGGNTFPIIPQKCKWINTNIPNLRPQLATLPLLSKCTS